MQQVFCFKQQNSTHNRPKCSKSALKKKKKVLPNWEVAYGGFIEQITVTNPCCCFQQGTVMAGIGS